MRFASKRELLEQIETEHTGFVELASVVPRQRWSEPGLWGDGWTLKDLLAHLTEWEQMFLRWHCEGCAGRQPAMPTPGYKWNQTPELNREIWRRHRDEPVGRVVAECEASYDEILSLARGLSQEELFDAGHFAWPGSHPLTTDLAPNTCSHYRTATRLLKRWLRDRRRSPTGAEVGRIGRGQG